VFAWHYVLISLLRHLQRRKLRLTPNVITVGNVPLTSRELVDVPELLVQLDLPVPQECKDLQETLDLRESVVQLVPQETKDPRETKVSVVPLDLPDLE